MVWAVNKLEGHNFQQGFFVSLFGVGLFTHVTRGLMEFARIDERKMRTKF